MHVAPAIGLVFLLAQGLDPGTVQELAGSPRLPLVLHLSPFAEGCVRRAVDLALARLAQPGCPDVYDDFILPDGSTPHATLRRQGIGPTQLIERLVFFDGTADHVCRQGRAALTTTPGSHLIFVCPRFIQLTVQNPDRSADLIIHESLHVLGLGENPPSSGEITNRVEQRCWR